MPRAFKSEGARPEPKSDTRVPPEMGYVVGAKDAALRTPSGERNTPLAVNPGIRTPKKMPWEGENWPGAPTRAPTKAWGSGPFCPAGGGCEPNAAMAGDTVLLEAPIAMFTTPGSSSPPKKPLLSALIA